MTCQRKKLFFEFLKFLALKRQSRHSCLALAPKTLHNLLCLFWGYSKKFLRPCAKLTKTTFQMKVWNWGPITVWRNLPCARFFLFQKSLHPSVAKLNDFFHSTPKMHLIYIGQICVGFKNTKSFHPNPQTFKRAK